MNVSRPMRCSPVTGFPQGNISVIAPHDHRAPYKSYYIYNLHICKIEFLLHMYFTW